jgi:hypothetical protein
MIERQQERRSLPTPGDRRKQNEDPAQLDWSDAVPGAIRPGVGEEKPPVERRRYLDGGCE